MPTEPLELIGRTLADKYLVESVVGSGGFSTVYRALHTTWRRPVALKVFSALRDVSEKDRVQLLEEFVQEGAVLADLSTRSAAIVQALDVGMLAGADGATVPYIVLEWLDGQTLESALATEVAAGLALRSIPEAVALLDPIGEALALAHRKGVAHRDVKPGNIFVLGDPRGDCSLKLLDFGIAKVVSDAQRMAGSFARTTGHVTSFTPAYGAPEQFSRAHGATGPWTDVFALATILTELVTGKEPLQGDDFTQLAVASASPDRRPTPRTLGADVSDEVEAVCARAVAVKPSERWPSAGEFWGALREALHLEPLRATRATMESIELPRVSLASDAPPTSSGPVAGTSTLVPAPHERGLERRAALWLGVAAVVVAGAAAAVLKGDRGSAAPAPSPSAATPPPAPSGSAAGLAATREAACPPGTLRIPGGSFYMGSDDDLPFEKPAHQVTLEPFCMDELEVTVEQYKACSDEGRCKRAGITNVWDSITDAESKAFDPLCNVRDPDGKAKHPVNCVDWSMADKYCREQGKHLPTEAQWEFAARGPDGRKYPWGDEPPSADRLNSCGKECMLWGRKSGVEEKAMYDVDDGFPNTAPVGSFPKGASRYGVQDVVGNVWEWVADWYGPYGADEQRDPKGPDEGEARVIRGGAWNASYPAWVRPTFRYKDAPTKRSYGIGFRCAK